jgi:ribosome recycling factor
MIRGVIVELSTKMQKTADGLAHELASIRTGQASSGLLDNVMVDYQSETIPIRQLANITTPEVNLIVIQPWDRTSVKAIERAILKSNIGLSPSSDGNLIRISIPPLSEERRDELAKLLSNRIENYRVILRNIRREAIGKIRKMEKDKEISADELKNGTKQIDRLTESFVDRVNQLGKDKEKEIKEI